MNNQNQVGYINNSKALSNMPVYSTVNKSRNGQHTKRYYSSTEAEIFFNGSAGELLPSNGFVDEVVQIQFTIQQNVLPLFGYNSYVYDEVAVGSRIVQGAFSINFTSPNYLFDMLEIINGDVHSNKDTRALWQAPFSIDIVYGGRKTTVNNKGSISTIEPQRGTLEGVSILSCSQELNIDGEPIIEHYSFVARDYVPSSTQIKEKESNKDNEHIIPKDSIKIENIIKDAFLWKNNKGKWFVFVDTNKNYSSELESMEVILKDGFTPKNIRKKAVRQKGGRWGVKDVSFRNEKDCAIEITIHIKGSGEQSITKSKLTIKNKI